MIISSLLFKESKVSCFLFVFSFMKCVFLGSELHEFIQTAPFSEGNCKVHFSFYFILLHGAWFQLIYLNLCDFCLIFVALQIVQDIVSREQLSILHLPISPHQQKREFLLLRRGTISAYKYRTSVTKQGMIIILPPFLETHRLKSFISGWMVILHFHRSWVLACLVVSMPPPTLYK